MGQANIAERQSNDLTNIENAILEEDSRLRDINVGLDTMELQGNQKAAADARFASQQAMQAGIQGVADTTQQAIAMPNLYSRNRGNEKSAMGNMQLSPDEMGAIGNIKGNSIMGPDGSDGFTNLDFTKINNMSNAEYRRFIGDLSPEQLNLIKFNPQYTNAFSPIK